MTKLTMLTRMGTGLTVLTITLLSLVPGNMRPHILGNDHLEHFAAYFVTATLWAVGNRRPMKLLSSGLLLAICAGLLEFVQLWIPGRTASALDFATSAIGAWIGLLVMVAAKRAHDRAFVHLRSESDCSFGQEGILADKSRSSRRSRCTNDAFSFLA